MCKGIQMIGLCVRDQEEALAYYVEDLGFRIATDVRKGEYRAVTLLHPDGASVELSLYERKLP